MSSENDPSCVDIVFESAARKAHILEEGHGNVAPMKATGGNIPKYANMLKKKTKISGKNAVLFERHSGSGPSTEAGQTGRR